MRDEISTTLSISIYRRAVRPRVVQAHAVRVPLKVVDPTGMCLLDKAGAVLIADMPNLTTHTFIYLFTRLWCIIAYRASFLNISKTSEA